MNLTDKLTRMQAEGKSVVSISFILSHLRSTERHESTLDGLITIPTEETPLKAYNTSARGGD